MVKCTVKSCGSRSEIHHKIGGVTFHTVPKDSRRKEKWIDIIRLLRRETDWWPSNRTVICSKHFKDEDKIQPKHEKGNVRLSQKAIPMVDDSSDVTKPGSSKEMEVDSNIDTDEEMHEILESSRIRKMNETINRLKLVAKRRLQCVQTLKQRNKRLVMKNKKLTDVINEMKEKLFR